MTRDRLPTRRRCETFAPRLVGHRVHVSLGRFPDGRVGEVWLDIHKEGAPLQGMVHALAKLASTCLQAGVSVGEVAHALRGIAAEPSGVVEDCDGITEAASVPDLIGQILEVHGGPRAGPLAPDIGSTAQGVPAPPAPERAA